MSTYTLSTSVPRPFADTVEMVRTALADQGFGILTEIDMQATLKAKLEVDPVKQQELIAEAVIYQRAARRWLIRLFSPILPSLRCFRATSSFARLTKRPQRWRPSILTSWQVLSTTRPFGPWQRTATNDS